MFPIKLAILFYVHNSTWRSREISTDAQSNRKFRLPPPRLSFKSEYPGVGPTQNISVCLVRKFIEATKNILKSVSIKYTRELTPLTPAFENYLWETM